MTTLTVSATDLPAIRTTITFIVDFIDEYAWHKPDCAAIDGDVTGDVTGELNGQDCDCGYNDALETLNTLRVRPVNA